MYKNILLVEDNQILAENILDILAMEGYQVALVNDGLQALDYLKNTACDIIITDIVMPNMDGLSLIRELRKHENLSQIPVMILSAKVTFETEEDKTFAESNFFVKKPCDAEHLLQSVEKLLNPGLPPDAKRLYFIKHIYL
jgi:CheY-like chemotaxis protein